MIDIKRCEYKGVAFIFKGTSTTGGNRIIKFNYPGSDKQSIERQGKMPRSFSISGIIPHDNYFIKRQQLINVLEDGKKGVLIHPFWGDIENIINGEYTIDETLSELGKADITIQFEIDDGEGIPVQSGDLQTLTEFETGVLSDVSFLDIVNNYLVSTNLIGNMSDAIESLQDVVNVFRAVSELSEQIVSQASSFYTAVDSFESSIISNIQAPQSLANDMDGIFSGLSNLFSTPRQRLTVFQSLFDFGIDDPVIRETTAGRKQRKKNRDTIRATVRTQALSNAYLAAVLIDYDTTDELDIVQGSLEAQYLALRNMGVISNATQEQLDRTRVQALKTLDNARVTTNQIITVETTKTPLSVLLYSYYGHTNFFDVVSDLNNTKNNAFVDGEVKLLVEP